MISLEHVTVHYGNVVPLDNVSVEFALGTTAVMGPSGSGKSTLLRVIAGLRAPSSGEVTIDDAPVTRVSWRTASDSRVSVVHQDYRLVPFLTVEENLLLAAELRGLRPSSRDVVQALERVALPGDLFHRQPPTMSGGEQQRAAIARALITGGSVIVADEPTGALDEENTERITDVLVDLGRNDNLSIVVATHDPSVAERLDHGFALARGALVPSA